MTEDIQIDFDTVTENINDTLEYIKELRSNKQHKNIFSEKYCNYLEEKEKELRKYIDAPFNIIVVGDFKRGKSSLINALLGKDLLPSNITPETVTINKISYGDAKTAEIYLDNNIKKIISIDDIKRESLEPIIQSLSSKPRYISIKDNNEILKNVNFIDTPGLNDAVDSFDEVVVDYLTKADAVIYVVSASFPMSLNEQNFLSELILPIGLAKVIVILNMCDCLETEEEIKEIKNFTKKKCYEINPEIEVYAISSLEELHRLNNEQSSNPNTSDYLINNFSLLNQTLKSEIIYKTESLKAVNCINHTKTLLHDVRKKCSALKQSIVEQNVDNHSALKEKENAIQINQEKMEAFINEIEKLIDDKAKESDSWMKQYLSRIKNEIQNINHNTSSEQIEKHIKFYFSDMLKKGFEACINFHIKELEEIIKTEIKEITLNDDVFNTSMLDEGIDISETLDTFGISENLDVINLLSYNLTEIIPVGHSLISIIQLIEGLFRENKKNSEKTRIKITDQLLSAYNIIEEKTQESLTFIYDKYKKHILNQIKQTMSEKQLSLFDNFEQVKRIFEDETQNNELVLKDLDSIISKTEKYYKQLCVM